MLSGGAETVSAGGTVAGVMTFAENSTGGELTIAATSEVALTVSGFAKSDTLDLAGFAFDGVKRSFKERHGKTSGALAIRDGALTAAVLLFGQYVAGGFKLSSDGAGGTDINLCHAQARP